jgi:beta-lactamase regulating signal transducer with metallopeptidase domain
MTAWWMAQLLIIGTLLALAAMGAELALGTLRRPTRWAWVAALASTLLLGGLAANRYTTSAPVSPVPAATVAATRTAITAPSLSLAAQVVHQWQIARTQFNNLLQHGWRASQQAMPTNTNRWLLVLWLASSAGILIFVVAAHWRYRRARAHWPIRTLGTTDVRVADNIGPAVIGIANAEIVVPQWLLKRDASEQALVLEHEIEHLRQHDPILLALAQLAVIVMPWHPAVWWMATRLRLAVELDCDRRVLQRGTSPRAYGTLLIDLADHRTGFGAAVPAFSCSPSHLERRLIAMTPRPLRYPLARTLTAGAIASLAVLAACQSELPTSQEIDQMTASTAAQVAGRAAMIDTGTVTYVIDEVPVTKAEADKLAAENIASVDVIKQSATRGGEVRIRTRAAGARNPNGVVFEERAISPGAPSARMTFTPADSSVPRFAPSGVVREGPSRAREQFAGLMVVDGVITDLATANAISPNDVVSVNVLKGPAAQALYSDPRAANGVIQITTKKAKP